MNIKRQKASRVQVKSLWCWHSGFPGGDGMSNNPGPRGERLPAIGEPGRAVTCNALICRIKIKAHPANECLGSRSTVLTKPSLFSFLSHRVLGFCFGAAHVLICRMSQNKCVAADGIFPSLYPTETAGASVKDRGSTTRWNAACSRDVFVFASRRRSGILRHRGCKPLPRR